MNKIDMAMSMIRIVPAENAGGTTQGPIYLFKLQGKEEARQAILTDLLALPELQINGNFDDYDEDEEVGAKSAIRDICQALIDYFEGVEK